MTWKMVERREIQTDGQRNRPTEESSAWFTAGFIGDLCRRLGRRRPACGQKYRGERKSQIHHFKQPVSRVKQKNEWNHKSDFNLTC